MCELFFYRAEFQSNLHFECVCRTRRPSRSSILVLGDDTLGQISTGTYPNNNPDIMMHPLENGQHREMAVDVPDHFVGINKTQPRYPPPPRTLNNQSTPGTKPLPPPRMDSNNDRVTPQLPSKQTTTGKIGQILEPTNDQMDTIKKYQDQLRLRREKEERIAATNEFLRNSVRGSQKLATLKADHIAPPPIGFDNDAYLIDEDDVNKVNLIGE